jgi:VWFA-related protein
MTRAARVLPASALAVLLAAGGHPHAAQQAGADQQTFRSRTDVVPVYAVVRDASGQPVHGLTKDDFTLLDRKRPQAIDLFEEVSRPATRTSPAFAFPPTLKLDVAANRGLDQDRVAVIVVDDLHLFRDRADRAKAIAREFIEKLGLRTPMAVLRTTGTGSTPVTDDHATLMAAVDGIKGERGVRRPVEAYDAHMPATPASTTDLNANAARAAETNGHSLKDFYDDLAYYKTLRDAASLLGAAGGRRKVFVIISEGIGKDLSWLPDGQSPCIAEAGGACYHDLAILDMMRSLQRANVVTYAVDPRGRVGLENLLQECFPSPPNLADNDPCSSGVTDWDSVVRQAQQGLEFTAAATGGFAITNTDDFSGGVDRIVADLENYYVLGFYPADATKAGFRELSVKVNHPDATIRARPGYEVGQAAKTSRAPDALAALVDETLPDPGLPMRLFAVPLPGPKRETRVALTIEITEPRQEVESADGRLGDEVRYAVLVVSTTSGKPVTRFGNTARLTSRRAMNNDSPAGVAYQMPMTLTLAPGRYQLRASATSSRLKRGGSVYLDLEIPDFTRGEVAASGIVLGYADGPHVPQTGVASALPFPPSLDRDFRPTDTLRAYAEVVNRAATAIEVTISLIDSRDHAVIATSQPIARSADRAEPMTVILPLNGLPPGAYRVRLTAAAGALAPREVGIVLH